MRGVVDEAHDVFEPQRNGDEGDNGDQRYIPGHPQQDRDIGQGKKNCSDNAVRCIDEIVEVLGDIEIRDELARALARYLGKVEIQDVAQDEIVNVLARQDAQPGGKGEAGESQAATQELRQNDQYQEENEGLLGAQIAVHYGHDPVDRGIPSPTASPFAGHKLVGGDEKEGRAHTFEKGGADIRCNDLAGEPAMACQRHVEVAQSGDMVARPFAERPDSQGIEHCFSGLCVVKRHCSSGPV